MLQQNKTLTSITQDIVQDKLTTLYESLDGIGDSKAIEDLMNVKVNNLKDKAKIYEDEILDLTKTSKEQQMRIDKLGYDLMEIIS